MRHVFLAVPLLALLVGCADPEIYPLGGEKPLAPLTETASRVGATLYGQFDDRANPDGRLVAAVFTPVDDLAATSDFGRFLSEAVAADLASRGVRVLEERLRTAMAVGPDGKFMLSNNLGRIDTELESAYALVGTYTVGERQVAGTVRIVDRFSGEMVASTNFEMARDTDVDRMLGLDFLSRDSYRFVVDRGLDGEAFVWSHSEAYTAAFEFCQEREMRLSGDPADGAAHNHPEDRTYEFTCRR